jgi:hypothetical protein
MRKIKATCSPLFEELRGDFEGLRKNIEKGE